MIGPKVYAFFLVVVGVSSLGCGGASAANQTAKEILAKKVRRCGNSWYTRWNVPPESPKLFEFRDFDWKIESEEISEADRLNGIAFHGFVLLSWSSSRGYYGKGWGEWQGRDSWSPFPRSLEILEKNDAWTFHLLSLILETLSRRPVQMYRS